MTSPKNGRPGRTAAPKPKVRLVQMIVQPVIVADDGENLTPLQIQQITVSGADWSAFSAEKWPELMRQIADEVAAAEQPSERP